MTEDSSLSLSNSSNFMQQQQSIEIGEITISHFVSLDRNSIERLKAYLQNVYNQLVKPGVQGSKSTLKHLPVVQNSRFQISYDTTFQQVILFPLPFDSPKSTPPKQQTSVKPQIVMENVNPVSHQQNPSSKINTDQSNEKAQIKQILTNQVREQQILITQQQPKQTTPSQQNHQQIISQQSAQTIQSQYIQKAQNQEQQQQPQKKSPIYNDQMYVQEIGSQQSMDLQSVIMQKQQSPQKIQQDSLQSDYLCQDTLEHIQSPQKPMQNQIIEDEFHEVLASDEKQGLQQVAQDEFMEEPAPIIEAASQVNISVVIAQQCSNIPSKTGSKGKRSGSKATQSKQPRKKSSSKKIDNSSSVSITQIKIVSKISSSEKQQQLSLQNPHHNTQQLTEENTTGQDEHMIDESISPEKPQQLIVEQQQNSRESRESVEVINQEEILREQEIHSIELQKQRKIDTVKKLLILKKCIAIKKIYEQRDVLTADELEELEYCQKYIFGFGRYFMFQNIHQIINFDQMNPEALDKLYYSQRLKEYYNLYYTNFDLLNPARRLDISQHPNDSRKQCYLLEKAIHQQLITQSICSQPSSQKHKKNKAIFEATGMKAEDLAQKKKDHPELTPVKDIDDKIKRYTYNPSPQNSSKQPLKIAKKSKVKRHVEKELLPTSLIPKKRKMKQFMNLSKLENEVQGGSGISIVSKFNGRNMINGQVQPGDTLANGEKLNIEEIDGNQVIELD